MAFLTTTDRTRIERAVAEAERKTSAEFVTVIARQSDDYAEIPPLAAAVVTFVLSGIALLLPIAFSHVVFWSGQVLCFIVLALLFAWTPLTMRLVPRALRERRANQLAHAQFLDRGLATTAGRTGVMLFVSAAEHYVEIIADRGAASRIDDAEWRAIIEAFSREVRAGQVAAGFEQAIAAVADLLARHLPRRESDVNELPDRLIEL